MTSWILTSDQLPTNGQLVVKYWSRTGSVWSGKHVAHPKHESFDKWFPLPTPLSFKGNKDD